MRAVLSAALLPLLLLSAGCAGSGTNGTRLHLDATNPGRGEHVRLELRCEPARGSVFQPARVCAAIARWPGLVLDPSLVNCKGGPFSHWAIRISGLLGGRSVAVRAATCDAPQTVLGALGIGASHTVPSTMVPAATPEWVRERAALLGVELNDPQPRSTQISLGDQPRIALWGDFDCRTNCQQRYGARAGRGHIATLVLDAKVHRATRLSLASP